MAEMKLEGAEDLERALKTLARELGDKHSKRVVVNGLRAGARIIMGDAKSRVPVHTGDLKKSMVVQSAPRDSSADVVIGFRRPAGSHAHLVEFGARGGQMRARPFMRPAIDAKGQAAVQKTGENIWQGILKTAAKHK